MKLADVPDYSVVIPVKEERDNVLPLAREIVAALGSAAFEIIFVDDCSNDDTVAVLASAQSELPMVRCLRHDRNCGQSSAIRTGIFASRAKVIVTLDGDGQNDPADIPALITKFDEIQGTNVAMVGGHRMKRQDTWHKRAASQAANGIRSRLLGDNTQDAGCGLKIFYREAYLRLPYFDHMHRFMSALMLREGFEVEFVPVSHRPRRHGASKYGVLDRLWVSLSDIMGVMWLSRRCRLPAKLDEMDRPSEP
ncbi:MAG: glycosyltransferase family 2 protein [Pseudomonadota bacterium]